MATFRDLNITKPFLNALDDLGYETPTPIQEQAFPIVMSGKDLIGVAQTGTGKTIAYMLPLLRSLPFSAERKPRILVLVPTRELVFQVVEHIEQLIHYTNMVVQGFYGGANIKTQGHRALEGMDICVSTPGRLFDLVMAGAINLKAVKKLVIDEADEMLNLGLRHQLINLFDHIPEKRQSLLFSATFSYDVEEMIKTYFNRPQMIEIERSGIPLDTITQSAYSVDNFYTKTNLLEHLLTTDESMDKVMVFVKNKNIAELLFRLLDQRLEPGTLRVIHTSKSQNFRIRSVKMFAKGEVRVLIATDLIARGVDIADVTHVINFNLPQTPETYIHRIGRTGRAEKEGIALSFVNEIETPYFKQIEALMEQEVPFLDFPEEVEVSDQYLDEEKLKLGNVNYRKPYKADKEKGAATQEKKAKNTKVNSKRIKNHPENKAKKNRNQQKQKAKKARRRNNNKG